MIKNNKKIIWLGLLISFFFLLIFVFTKDIKPEIKYNSPPTQDIIKTENKNNAFLEINNKRLETSIPEK